MSPLTSAQVDWLRVRHERDHQMLHRISDKPPGEHDAQCRNTCAMTTEAAADEFGWGIARGVYTGPDRDRDLESRLGGRYVHTWNVLADGTIVDPTAIQFPRSDEEVRVLPPSDPKQRWYQKHMDVRPPRTAALQHEALPQSWRPYTHEPVEGMADAVIVTDVQNPMRGQRTFEVWTYGVWVASRHRLDDAKAYLERIYGPLNWKRQTNPPKEMVHYYFGPTTEFTEPVTFYTADLPKLGAKASVQAYFEKVVEEPWQTPWIDEGIHIALDPYTWRTMPVEQVPVRGLNATQTYLNEQVVDRYAVDPDPRGGNEDLTWVVFWKGEGWIIDGHHRVAGAIKRGDPTIEARVMRPMAGVAKQAGWTDSKQEWDAAAMGGMRWVFHATTRDVYERMVSQGVRVSDVPMNLNRRRYQEFQEGRGTLDDIFFQPGAGVGMGTYVGGSVQAVAGFGRYIVAMLVPERALERPPEANGATDPIDWFLGNSLGMLLTEDVPPDRVVGIGRITRTPASHHPVDFIRDAREASKTAAGRLIGYHRSKVANRESIQRHGLEAGRSLGGRNFRVYLDTVRKDPAVRMDTKPTDLWEVDYTGLPHRVDPELPDRWVIVEADVPPDRLRLVATTEDGTAQVLGERWTGRVPIQPGQSMYRGLSVTLPDREWQRFLDDWERGGDLSWLVRAVADYSGPRGQGIGKHWTTDHDTGRYFATSGFITPFGTGTSFRGGGYVGIVLEAEFSGGHMTDVEELQKAWRWESEQEVTISPGTRLTLRGLEVYGPRQIPEAEHWDVASRDGEWRSYRTGMQVTAADYWGGHRPPEDGPPLYDLLEGDSWFPDDVYTSPHFYTFGGNEPFERESIEVVQATRGQPQAMVTIYRSLPPDADPTIGRGDWVTLSEAYARQHGMHATDPAQDWPVVSARVPARTVRNGGNDIIEWGYFGSPVRGRTASLHVRPLLAADDLPDGAGMDSVLRGKRGARLSASPDGSHIGRGQLREGTGFPSGVSSSGDHLGAVDGVGSQGEVGRLAARRVVTGVEDQQSPSRDADPKVPSEYVGRDDASMDAQLPVASSSLGSGEDEAPGRIITDKEREQSFLWGAEAGRLSGHGGGAYWGPPIRGRLGTKVAVALTRTPEGYEATIGRWTYRVRRAGDLWEVSRGAGGGEYPNPDTFPSLAAVREHLAEVAAEGQREARQPKPGRLVLLDVDALVRTWHLHRIDRYKRDRLVEAIEAEGLRRPPYMSGAEGDRGLAIKLLDGNHRVAAVAELGWRQVPVWVEDTIPDDELRSQGLVRGGVQTMPMATYGDFPTPYRGELGRFATVAGVEDTIPLHEAVEALEERYADLMGAGTRQAADALSGALDVLGSDRAYGLKEAERARRLLSSPPRGSQSDDDAAIRRFLMALSRTIERVAGAYPSSRVPRYFTDELRRAWTAMEALLPRHAAGGTRWYHGTNHTFTPGDHVGPGDQHGVNHPGRNDRVWVSNNAWIASKYGSRTFEVIPDDEPRPHGNSALAKDEFHCSGAAVVREISSQEILDASNQWYRDRHPLASRQASVADDPQRWQQRQQQWDSGAYPSVQERVVSGGYVLHLGPLLRDPEGDVRYIHALTADGEYVGQTFVGFPTPGSATIEGAPEVKPEHRRKGLASAMYQWAEEVFGAKIVPADSHTDDAAGLWGQPNRTFGKQAARAYYHGSDREFEPGDLIQPQSETGVPNWAEQMGMGTSVMGPHYSAEHVYLADNATTAMDFGDSVYEVEPLGPVVRDPEDMGTGWYRTQGAARVVRKVVYKNRPLAKRAAHETLYHGTDRMLEPGGLLLSPAETGATPSAPVSRLDRVYLTNDPGEAAKYGDYVYEVEALGKVEVGYWWPDHERLAPAAEVIRRMSKTAARGDGDGWIEASDGNTYWGRYGAAGLLVVHTDEEGTARFFLQQRAAWVDEGGTWGIPGGAIDSNETPLDGAVREFTEETGVPGHRLGAVIDEWSFEPAPEWSYTTVVVEAEDQFDSHYNAEQSGTGWFTYGEMQAMRLHPGLRDSLPKIRRHGHHAAERPKAKVLV